MFLENDYARPLFDFDKGGKAKAFECLLPVKWDNWKLHEALERLTEHPCGKITRTERGMRMHLKQVHGWKEQPCLYSTDNQNEPKKGEARKLRMFTKENIAATTKRSLMNVTKPEADHQAALLQLHRTRDERRKNLRMLVMLSFCAVALVLLIITLFLMNPIAMKLQNLN